MRCLEKDARRRIRDIGDVQIEIDDALGGGTTGADRSSAVSSASSRAPQVVVGRTTFLLAVAALVGLLAVAGGLWWASARRAVPTQYQFSLSPPAGMHFVSLEVGGPAAISPDGETLAFVAADRSGESSIWTRRLNSVDATRLGGTDGGSHTFWSPDSRFIGFQGEGKLKKIDTAGGPALALCDVPNGTNLGGASWSKDGVILFTPDFTAGLYRTTAEGGKVEQITAPDFSKRETSHRWPSFLPDGQRFLFLVRSDRPEVQGLYLGALNSKEFTRLLSIPSGAVYATSLDTGGGYLVYAERSLLTAQPFSPATGRLSGDASTIARLPTPPEDTSVTPASASTGGLLVFEGGTLSRQTMAWVDRTGKELGVVSAEGQFRNPRLSPDRRKVAIEKLEFQTGLGTIWLFDLDRDLQQRLTTQEGAFSPVWSPDGKYILFVSYRGTQWDLIRRNTSDESDAKVLRTSTVQAATDWSKDGQWIIFQEKGAGTNDAWDIGALEVATGKTRTLVSSVHDERQGQLSPDNSWLAYTSNQSGQDQVYLQRFPLASPRSHQTTRFHLSTDSELPHKTSNFQNAVADNDQGGSGSFRRLTDRKKQINHRQLDDRPSIELNPSKPSAGFPGSRRPVRNSGTR
jgi:Tol biopolymer transport system component